MDEKYFIAKIAVETLDNDSGKVKIKREEKLVSGYNPTDVEAKVTKVFEN